MDASRLRALVAAAAAVAACLSQGFASAGPAGAPPVALQTCRPRLFIRPAEWSGGLSVAQLRRRVQEPPFKDRVRLLRSTTANLALKWLIEGDEAAAAAALAQMKAFDHRVTDSEDGTQLIDLALGYDWLYGWPGFPDAEKRAVEAKMVALGQAMKADLAGPGAHIFHTRMYSWNAAVGMAGLALHDRHPGGRDLFLFAKDYYEQRLLPARRLQGGAVHNGFLYAMNYMMFPTLQFLKAARSAADVDYFHTAKPADSDWLREMADFMVYGTRPDLLTVRFADLTTQEPAKHFRFALDIFAAEYRNGHAAELARRICERYQTSGYHAEWIYLFLLFHDPTVEPKPFDDLPVFRLFSRDGLGHAFFRSDWSKDGVLVHFRCGDYFGDHGHFDQGAFTVFKRQPLALKGGYYDFGSDHRLHYYKQAISTNTVIFSDAADTADEGRQRNVRYQEAGTVEDYLARKTSPPYLETGNIIAVDDPAVATSTAKDVHVVSADVTPAWDAKKVRRHVRRLAFVGGRHLVVVDETETASPTVRARWLLHTQVKPVLEAGVWVVRHPETVLFVQPVLPSPAKATLIGGPGRECEVNGVNWTYLTAPKYVRSMKPKPDAQPEPGLGLWRMEIEAGEPAAKRLFVVVLTAEAAAASPPRVRAALEGGDLVVRIDDQRLTFHGIGR